MNLSQLTQKEKESLSEILSDPGKWAEAFLIEPDTLQPFKCNYVQDCIFQTKGDRIVIRCHRRSGKSTGLSIVALWATAVNRGYEVLVMAPDQDKVNEIFAKMRAFLRVSPLVPQPIVGGNSQNPQTLIFPNDASVRGKTTGSVSNKKGDGARGKGADMVILDETQLFKEDDWLAMNAILVGDEHRREEDVIVYASGTCNENDSRFKQWCLKPEEHGWAAVFVPVVDNPGWSEKRKAKARATSSDREWEQEWLCQFPDQGDNAIRKTDIEASKKVYTYINLKSPGHKLVKTSNPRVMGVDWDTVSAGVNIVILEMDVGIGRHRVLYREEVPRGEYTLTRGTKRVIELNTLFQPDWVYVDRGFGEMQVETLELYGRQNPSSGLAKKIVPMRYQENIQIQDPITGKMVNYGAKAIIIQHFLQVIAEHRLEFPETDKKFISQLEGYRILGSGRHGIITSRRNEHIIDACALASWGMFKNYGNKFYVKPAQHCLTLPPPTIIKSKETINRERDFFSRQAPAVERTMAKGFARGTISKGPVTRSKF